MSMKYKDPTASIDERVADLLSRMTMEEKIAHLNQAVGCEAYCKKDGEITVSDEYKSKLSAGIGSLYGVLRADPWTKVSLDTGLSPREGAVAVNTIQRFAIENSRLGIPLMFAEECQHGHMAIGNTTFPMPIAMASTWNPKLMERIMIASAAETRAQGCNVTFSPIQDVARDPRWGRIEEMFGEDTYLCTRMGVSAVRGLQGESLSTDHTIVATIKHFAHATPEAGRNAAPAHVGPREMKEVFLPPYKAALDAGAQSVMCSYNEIDGIPCSASHELLTTILRDEWGFEGFVISDLCSVRRLMEDHHLTHNLAETSALTLNAGLDVELAADVYWNHLPTAVRHRMVSEETIDLAVSRVLRVKFMLGLFENPYGDPDLAERIVGCDEHRELAREAARQCTVLLKNDDNLLPLKKDLKSIAVIGPSADNFYNLLGDYTSPQYPGKVVSVLDGIKAKMSPDTIIRHARGCAIRNPSKEGFAEAVEAARNSDVAVVVVGGSSARGFGPDSFDPDTGAAIPSGGSFSEMDCGEGLDRASLDLAGVQMDLVKEIHATGTPVVIVLVNGRPYTINWIAENIPAILVAWYPGQEGGNGIADVLFGDYNPAGRLPMSFPRSTGQLPIHYSAKPTARKYSYVDDDGTPLYPFGYGLSYTTFRYDNLRVTPDRIVPGGTAEVSVDVTNTGGMAGDEVAQMYIHDEVSSVTRPIMELKGFERVRIAPGETRTVVFTISSEELQFVNVDMEWVVEPGTFTIMVGGSSTELQSVSLEVTE